MKWNNWIRKKTDKHLLRGAGKWRRKKKYKNLLFFPLSEGVASPFNQVFLISHYGKKKMLIVRPLKYSLRFNKLKSTLTINQG